MNDVSILIKVLYITKFFPMFPCRTFVEESMGTKCVGAARLEFEKLYEDSCPSTPVFFILSPGVDPLKDVEKVLLLFIYFAIFAACTVPFCRVYFKYSLCFRYEAGICH